MRGKGTVWLGLGRKGGKGRGMDGEAGREGEGA